MTATPIPRTAAMTVYGDLDVSVLDDPPAGPPARSSPPGPAPRTTRSRRGRRCAREVAAGRQAYVVCPLIEESDKLEVALGRGDLRPAGGRRARRPAPRACCTAAWRPAEKEATMHQFRAGRLDVLVATTVIEVGVDVPNATVMVILDADRFGIAQLHQLRGRVGRGSEQLVVLPRRASPTTPEAEARLGALVQTTDGFELAEVDLDLRGEGTIMGERQKGRNDLKLASLRRDRDWVEPGPRGRLRHRRRPTPAWRRTPTWPTRSPCSSTRTTRSSCSRAESGPSHGRCRSSTWLLSCLLAATWSRAPAVWRRESVIGIGPVRRRALSGGGSLSGGWAGAHR